MNGRLSVIGAPSSAGAFAPGQEDAPRALRQAGLLERLRERGAIVVDGGDIPRWRWRPDAVHRAAQNVAAVAASARAVAERVRAALDADDRPVVLGGDCTVELGSVAGALAAGHDPALLYFDIHPDLNTPRSVPDGALDWMGVAHLLDEPDAVAELAALGPRRPLLSSSRIVLFAHDSEHSTGWERERIKRLALRGIPVADVAANPRRAAREAIELATADANGYLVHFDVDSIDFSDMPLSENTGRNYGLSFQAAMTALDELLGDERVLGLTVTELNPYHGAEDGSTVRAFADRLAISLALSEPSPSTSQSPNDAASKTSWGGVNR